MKLKKMQLLLLLLLLFEVKKCMDLMSNCSLLLVMLMILIELVSDLLLLSIFMYDFCGQEILLLLVIFENQSRW